MREILPKEDPLSPWPRPGFPLEQKRICGWFQALGLLNLFALFSLPQYSLCNEPLIELFSSGASGSLFYVSSDDEFIIKTVQHKEAEFLQKLLPGYYMVRG